MSGNSSYVPKSSTGRWLESRLPIMGLVHSSFVVFPNPRNLNYFWTFGAMLVFMLVEQIVTGVVMAMHYVPNAELAFDSVERVMRDVNFGDLLRYTHANGASFFFIAVYIHMFRGLYYGSYKAPREVLWILGVIIYLLMMATAFMGYVLPWGQMSYWGATVITSMFGAVPLVGDTISRWLWGGYVVGDPTLNRFFALHYLLPFMILGVVILHIWALHVHGSNNPDGLDVKSDKDILPFHPYFTVKDGFAVAVFLIFYAYFVFFVPNYFGHADNYLRANSLATPQHIVPEWYFLPFYAILRSVSSKLLGVIFMFAAIVVLAFLPWLDWSRVRSGKYRPIFKWAFWTFVAVCLALGYLGSQPPTDLGNTIGRVLLVLYFCFFLVLLPLLGIIEKPLPRPATIADAVLNNEKALTRSASQS